MRECLECGTPGYFSGSGLCRRCERECLGLHERPAVPDGRCHGLECGAYVEAGQRYCPHCYDEIYGEVRE